MATTTNKCNNLSIVRGNDVVLKLWLYTRELQDNTTVRVPFDFAEGDKITVRLCKQYKSQTLDAEQDGEDENCVIVLLPWNTTTGIYALETAVERDGKHLCSIDCGRISIVECNKEANPTLERVNTAWQAGMEVDMQIAFSAVARPENDYELWKKLPGNENKSLQDFIDETLNSKVDKEEGKGLSTNDFTDEEKSKVDTAYQKPADGIPAADIASGVIPDVSQFITNSVDDLVNYYLKSETYTKAEVQALIGAIQQFHYEVYASTSDVTNPANNVLYLIGPTGSGTDKYEEYVYDSTKQDPWIKIGDTSIDLSGYVTTTTLNTALADYTTTAQLTTMLAGKQDVISDLPTIRSGAQAGATAYQKPQAGIPKTDLAQGVKDSLDKADTALQEDTLYEDANGHDYVEIAGMKWATMNVGASSPTEYGNYYQYGKGARTYQQTKEEPDYAGTENPLDLSVDTARQVWGGTWRMPTRAELQSLIANTNYSWETDFNGSGVNGGKFTDKTDSSKYIFIPAAGSYNYGSLNYVGSLGDVWSSSHSGVPFEAYSLYFIDGNKNVDDLSRKGGCSVRPILDTTQLKKDLDSKANDADLATVAKSGSYDDLTEKPTIPTVPTISTDIDADSTSDTKTASPKAVKTFVEGKGYLTQHQDISGKADKSEMSVADGEGANADKTTITLKSGLSATVLKSHQDISGKQDNLVSGTNIKTINNESILGAGNITIQGGGAAYTPTLQSAPTSSTTTYTKDGETVDFEVGQFARVANQDNPTGYDMWQLYDLTTENNVTTAAWRSMDDVIGDINSVLDNINGEVI